ncbi:shikimate dehydrogenase [bacterium]|nr:shikimate dehydrogenase [bacterium]
MLCAIIARQRHETLLEEMDEAVARGAKLLELRLDFLRHEPRLGEILKRKKVPVIATLRRKEDGGIWNGTEEKRQQLLRAAVALGFDYVDLEADVAAEIPRFGPTKRIVSHHEMTEMPHLGECWQSLSQLDPDVIKIAGLAGKATDNFKMLRMIAKAEVPTVGICMGEFGIASRVLGPKFGAPFTYCAFNPERIVAPGLMTFDQMNELYRGNEVNAKTEVFGVMGDPIAHSMSPLVHNTAFRELRMNRVYLPFRVTEHVLPKFLDKLSHAEVRGLSVTIPHKEAIVSRGMAGDELVAMAGAANTIHVDDHGAYRLYNTDGPAAMASLLRAMGEDPSDSKAFAGRDVLILGAGGVARPIAFSLHQAGAIVSVANRSADRAQSLAHAVGCKFIDWGMRESHLAEIVINCTKLGMHPDVDETPIQQSAMREKMIFFDTVYNPIMTKFLLLAKDRGAKIVTGVEMFAAQAEAQFRIFTGVDPPAGLMKQLVEEELSPARKMLREARLAKKDQV